MSSDLDLPPPRRNPGGSSLSRPRRRTTPAASLPRRHGSSPPLISIGATPRSVRNRVGVPLHAGCTRAVRSFRAGSRRCGRAGVDRRAAHSSVSDRQPLWTGWAVGGPGEVAERRGTVRSVAQLSAAGRAATDRGTGCTVTLRLNMDNRSAEVNIAVNQPSDPGSRSSSTWTGSGPASRSPTTCVDRGETACTIVAKLEPHCR